MTFAPVNGGDTAWVRTCAALALFMVPGLAIFYAGKRKSGRELSNQRVRAGPLLPVLARCLRVAIDRAVSHGALTAGKGKGQDHGGQPPHARGDQAFIEVRRAGKLHRTCAPGR